MVDTFEVIDAKSLVHFSIQVASRWPSLVSKIEEHWSKQYGEYKRNGFQVELVKNPGYSISITLALVGFSSWSITVIDHKSKEEFCCLGTTMEAVIETVHSVSSTDTLKCIEASLQPERGSLEEVRVAMDRLYAVLSVSPNA